MEDRVSMAHSVESRLPFLDYRLVEFNFQLDDQLKLDGGYTKAILRRAMRDILPHSLVDDRRKRRFSLPYLDWLRTTWRPLGEELLLSGECRVGPYVNLPVLRQQLSQFYDGKESTLRPWILWRILQTEMWLRSIVCRPAAGAVGARQ
jgi:asparagine synthase (glutamine-hydrolysing)